ncbi:Arsenate reductase, glutaredoxin family [Alkalispirochaeta americana]|uniref:Arsenate reductase, glutaredoxin family n=1 Tax=Alkalispirochaeta americana TaxID=159291 RepID=A0A1N6PP92_9SPIO|nr:glutaredoxin [Alkalispirochaeta americana]SIQ06147.1 Arsenate reductase, glutaredoxin family [Alkalispirochaeta americana]
MIPQIIGTKKSAAFRRCLRFCKERGITVQERDLYAQPLQPGELDTIAAGCGGMEALIDTDSKSYRQRGFAWMDYDPREELLEDPGLLRQPLVRCDRGVCLDPGEAELKKLLL